MSRHPGVSSERFSVCRQRAAESLAEISYEPSRISREDDRRKEVLSENAISNCALHRKRERDGGDGVSSRAHYVDDRFINASVCVSVRYFVLSEGKIPGMRTFQFL